MPTAKHFWLTPLDNIKDLYSSCSFPDVHEIVIGLTFCAICTTDNIIGLSFTAKGPQKPPILLQYPLVDRSWQELLNLYLSERPTERSLGLAAINTLSQTVLSRKQEYKFVDNGAEWLPNPKDFQIGMVGAIHPVIKQIVSKKGEVLLRDDTVLQRAHRRLPKKGVTLVPLIEDLKNVDHLLVTGSAIVHRGFNEILNLFHTIKGQRILIGPSAQILPQAAFNDGFTTVASSLVIQVDKVLQNIREGGGYHLFQKYCRKYVIRSL